MAITKQVLHVQAVVIGAGTAGISAFRQIAQSDADTLLIDPGPLGTTCARVGCMPSKALISVARDFHRRGVFEREGIRGSSGLSCDLSAVLAHVRALRDRFTTGMVETTENLAGDRLIREQAFFQDPHTLETDHYRINADRIIIATGATPRVPDAWRSFGDRILTSDTLFEQKNLPRRLAVIGLKLEGLELGQALARLGVEVVCFGRNKNIGGVTDPAVNEMLHKIIGAEVPVYSNAEAHVQQNSNGSLTVAAGEARERVDALLLSMGMVPNLAGLGLETLGVELDEEGLPPWNPQTGQMADLPIFLAGDVNQFQPVLHEAVDEGFIAAANAVGNELLCARRRVPMRICFSDPQAVVVGKSWADLDPGSFVVGSVDFDDDSRAVLEHRDAGRMCIYVDPQTGQLLGAELAAPEAEHLGHLLALALQQELTVSDMLKMPFYHPTHTEAVRSALRAAAQECAIQINPSGLDFHVCGSE